MKKNLEEITIEQKTRPEFLYTMTVEQTRQKYRYNVEYLDNIFKMVLSGCFEDAKDIVGESIINQMMTELVIQQEYIREREEANWGWNRETIDFSK